MEKLLEQLELFVDNFSYYQAYVNNLVNHVCAKTENYFGIKTGLIRTTVNEQINGMINGMPPKVMNFLVGTSLPAVKTMVDIIVSGAVMLVLFFLLVKDMEKIQQSAKNSIFGKELGFFYHRGKVVFQAYIKAQVIIMIAVAACSIFGFTFAGNRYAWILGIAVGILDALPLFGSGIILIPATILYMIDGNFLKTAIIFTTFIICYFVREILEPKLIGEKMGVGPVATLIGIYVGYRIFGFMGMFAGALVVVVLSDIVKWCER